MKTVLAGLFGGLLLIVGLGLAAPAAEAACLPDAVLSGTVCIDKYEASVWLVPPAQTKLIQKIRAGTATLAQLQLGGSQRGLTGGDLGVDCLETGAGCTNVYAVSIAGVTPAAFINWFQAAAAARNSHKRLPTNQEWQVAALGTPSASCNVSSGFVANTGSAAGCVSDVGAFDMVGNLGEWVAEWVPLSSTCGSWGSFSDDFQCLFGAEVSSPVPPGALVRGGFFLNGSAAGVFAVDGGGSPSFADSNTVGFRAAR